MAPNLASCHNLRRLMRVLVLPISNKEQPGRPLFNVAVKRISGHKTLAMVERYGHQSGARIYLRLGKARRSVSGGQEASQKATTSEFRHLLCL